MQASSGTISEAITARSVSHFQPDATDPQLLSFAGNLGNDPMLLSFSEVIDLDGVDLTHIQDHDAGTDPSTFRTLSLAKIPAPSTR